MKLTSKMLKRIIEEEASKLKSLKDADHADETKADDLADTVDNHVDFLKALKIEEARLLKRLKTIQEQKRKAINNILKDK